MPKGTVAMVPNSANLPLVFVALLTGCAVTPPAATSTVQPSVTYLAQGTEPFWNLEITADRLNLNRLGEPAIQVPNPGERREGTSRTIVTRQLSLRIVPGPCSDGMSERRFADSVSVRIGNGPIHLTGCGGAVVEPAASALDRSSWRITAFNGQPAVGGVHADLSFADGRVSGSTGCNRLNGAYTQERNRLSFAAYATTRMACPGPRGEQEVQLLRILREGVVVSFGERMVMTWTTPDGSTIALSRLDWD